MIKNGKFNLIPMSDIDIHRIEKIIYEVRGQRVMLDSDLAELYGVRTRELVRQVKRNITRFPEDFLIMFDFNEL